MRSRKLLNLSFTKGSLETNGAPENRACFLGADDFVEIYATGPGPGQVAENSNESCVRAQRSPWWSFENPLVDSQLNSFPCHLGAVRQ